MTFRRGGLREAPHVPAQRVALTVRRPTGPTPNAAAVGAKRPKGPTNGNRLGRSFASRPRSGAEGAASLDTEVLTQPAEPLIKTKDSHNSTAKRLRILTPRSEWLADVKGCSALYREQSARKLEGRSRAVGLERRREWRELRNAWRDRRTGRTTERGEHVHRSVLVKGDRLRLFNDPRGPAGSEMRSYVDRAWEPATDVLERLGGAPELESHWHTSRARTKREVFERVASCGESEGHRVTLVCRGCKDATTIEVGCGSKWFCPSCRLQQAIKFRKDFERKRVGLLTAATRAGLTRRKQKGSARWGERLLTLTLPHVGTPEERIHTLRATWLRFWRTLLNHVRPTLQSASGISFDVQSHNLPNGRKDSGSVDTMPLLDVMSYLHVFEWTPGKDDGLGHPHLHVWLFSRFLEQALLKRLWEAAHRHVMRQAVPIGPLQQQSLVVDIRKADDSVASELIKYLTKDWEVSDTGAKRAAPDVFARVYATLDGRRLKQSSAGFARWAVEKANVCPCCGFENLRGHWARVEIEHTLDTHAAPLGAVAPPGAYFAGSGEYEPMPLTGAGDIALRATHDAQRDADFLESVERRTVRARMQEIGLTPEPDPQLQPTDEEEQWQTEMTW